MVTWSTGPAGGGAAEAGRTIPRLSRALGVIVPDMMADGDKEALRVVELLVRESCPDGM